MEVGEHILQLILSIIIINEPAHDISYGTSPFMSRSFYQMFNKEYTQKVLNESPGLFAVAFKRYPSKNINN